MGNIKRSVNFIFLVVAIILGTAIVKQFDFENLKFKHTGLAILYIIVFAFSVYFLVKDYRKQPEK